MALTTGTRLGAYEILAPLGAGGMGEVYRARDTRLDRTVAIKVLPAHFSEDPARRQRFEREARALASLSHPHICTLYDVGYENGVDFLVMEFLEGETLAARLEKGPLPTPEVLRCGIEIADGLEKAHRQGVIHRDLKPGNIVLTRPGAKLLDFGLAKASTNVVAAAVSQLTTSPTVSQPLTAEGTIVGTLHYMAPEQLEGKEADARSDIFAFGAVLYEMATGRKAFDGKSQATVIAAILSSEPAPISSLQPMTPPVLDRIVKACLAKDPDARFQTAHDLKLQLQWIAEAGSQVGLPVPVAAHRRNRERLAWTLAAVVILVALVLAGTVAEIFVRTKKAEAVRFLVYPPEKTNFGPFGGFLTVSPDGRRVAFRATEPSGKDLLWVRPLNSLTSQPLQGTEGGFLPFWSHDSNSLAFFSQQKLKRIEVSGGPPQVLCDAPSGQGGTWSPRGVIVFGPRNTGGLSRVSDTGGAPTPVTTVDSTHHELAHAFPQFLPDGRHFLYFAWTLQPQERWVCVGSVESKEIERLLNVNSTAAYAPPGYLLFGRDGALLARAFNMKNLRFAGEPFQIADRVGVYEPAGFGLFSVSQNGVLAYHSETSVNTQLVWYERDGTQHGTVGEPGDYSNPALSPDGTKVAVGLRDLTTNNRDIWLFDLRRGAASRLTFDPADDLNPVWSSDGKRIVFTSDRKGHRDIYQKRADGVGGEEIVMESNGDKSVDDLSPDGRYVVYDTGGSAPGGALVALPLFGDRKPFPVLESTFRQRSAQFSPDGRYIAYGSTESGKEEVYVQTFPEARGRWQVSTTGGSDPKWRRDGKELFYLAEGRFMSVEVKANASQFEAGIPKPLFGENFGSGGRNRYVVTPDGQRFLVITRLEKGTTSPITVVVNWKAELTR